MQKQFLDYEDFAVRAVEFFKAGSERANKDSLGFAPVLHKITDGRSKNIPLVPEEQGKGKPLINAVMQGLTFKSSVCYVHPGNQLAMHPTKMFKSPQEALDSVE